MPAALNDTGLCSGFFPASPEKEPSHDNHRCSPNQEADVPVDPLIGWNCLVHMMDAEQVVMDQALDQVEGTETHHIEPGSSLPDQRT